MLEREQRAKALFEEALELGPGERAAWLAASCADDAALRARVEVLLAGAEADDGFLREPPARLALDVGERPGDQIGPYRLLERLGEGGFGAVFLAEQSAPVRRRVALKLVKAGMDTRAVVARFEHERQLLTLMDHPHVARVLDAGVTPQGRPYFAMEHVPGRPINEHCDRHALPVRARVALFLQVCEAVQHAHTMGVLHRDLKAGNVLVALRDGRSAARVIDFGVAKSLAPGTAPGAPLTEEHQLVGTVGHMSPEQAGAAPDVDTRSDVYALGVLLYELLVGSLPLEAALLAATPPTEALRMVREVDPPSPSARLARDPGALAGLAARRATTPERLRAELRGELDWIVMRALEKERERRYGSAEALRADLERFLRGEAVEAAPPSATYRLRKAVRRHRGAALAAALVGLVLLLGLTGTGLGLRRARAAQREALAQSEVAHATLGLLTRDLLSGVDPGSPGGRADVTVRELLDRAVARLDSGESLRAVAPDARQTVEVAVRCAAARSYRALGLYDEALAQAEAALALAGAPQPPRPQAQADALLERGELHRLRLERPEAERDLRRALELRRAAGVTRDAAYAEAANALAGLLAERRALDEALALSEEVLGLHRALFGARSAQAAMSLGNLAQVLMRLDRPAEAVALLEEALELHRALLGEDDVQVVRDLFNLGAASATALDLERAERFTRAALDGLLALYPDDHPVTAMCRRNLGLVLMGRGAPEEALPYYRAALAAERAVAGPSRALLQSSLAGLGRTLLALGEPVEAIDVLAEHAAVVEEVRRGEPRDWIVQEARGLLAQARLDAARAGLEPGATGAPLDAAVAAWMLDELQALEPLVEESLEVLRGAPHGGERWLADAETRRCLAAARRVTLYETWLALGARGVGLADGPRLAAALDAARAELGALRRADADAPVVVQ